MSLALALVVAAACGPRSGESLEQSSEAGSSSSDSTSASGVSTVTSDGTDGDVEETTGRTTRGEPVCDAIEIASPALETQVRAALGIPVGPIDPEDMALLTELERPDDSEAGKLDTLDGMECAVNLEVFSWQRDGGSIDDLGPLGGLSKLRVLVISGGRVEDLGPLAALTQLEVLGLRGQKIVDVGPLAALENLRELDLYHAQDLADIGPLAGLTQLESVELSSTAVADISALSGASNLARLWLTQTHVSDLSPLAGLQQLEELRVAPNVSDLTPIANLDALTTIIVAREVTELAPFAELPQIHYASFEGNEVSDLSGLLGASWETPHGCADLHLESNPLTEQTIAEDFPAVCAQNPGVTIWVGQGLSGSDVCNTEASCHCWATDPEGQRPCP